MITYVVDTNIFSRALNNLSFTVFEDIWTPWNKYMNSGRIVSVDEAYQELISHYGVKGEKGEWIKGKRMCFLKPSNKEGAYIAEIYKNKKFREGIKEKSLRSGTPEADAMIVAKAKILNGIVVTAESDEKPNSEKIPNICVSFGVPYIKIDDFYKMLKNVYYGKSELENVKVQYKLKKPENLKAG